MAYLIVDAMEEEWDGEAILRNRLKDKTYSYFRVKDYTIKPCACCDGCLGGKCVIPDVMQDILKGFAKSEVVVFISPIRFGGYSALMKRVVDRMMPVASALYIVEKDHLLHPTRYPGKRFIGLGFKEMNLDGEDDAFRKIISHNARNFQCRSYDAITFKHDDQLEALLNRIVDSLKGDTIC